MRRLIGVMCGLWLILGAATVGHTFTLVELLPSSGPGPGPEVSFDVFRPPAGSPVYEEIAMSSHSPDIHLKVASSIGGTPDDKGEVDVMSLLDVLLGVTEMLFSIRVSEPFTGSLKPFHDMHPGPGKEYVNAEKLNDSLWRLRFSPVLSEPPTSPYVMYRVDFELNPQVVMDRGWFIDDLDVVLDASTPDPPPSDFDVLLKLASTNPNPPPLPAGTVIGRWTITGVIVPEPSALLLTTLAGFCLLAPRCRRRTTARRVLICVR
ncbi:MAG: hypothetical protein L0228_07135 [Planctomycetes bacterium]|nr:hypothetical protein [Planctomycetota bacterium]